MGVSKYNSEGYYDPTAYEALTKITQEEKAARYRPLVYICSPYSGDTEGNTEKARRYSRFAADAGTIPIAPHLLFPTVPIGRNGAGAGDFYGSGAAGQV